MGSRRLLIAAFVLVTVGMAGLLAAPRRFVVEGVSMGPALLPGDVVRTGPLPVLDRLRRPRRFERWVLTATDELALKRVVGLPGEAVSLVDGDLAIDGVTVLKGPRLLAEMGSVVRDDESAATPAETGWAWSRPVGEVLDEASFDTAATRRLTAVRDVGFVAVVDALTATTTQPAITRIRVGDWLTELPLAASGRHAVVAGRLDGRIVVATWRVPPDARATAPRRCLPPAAPERWQVADPWPEPAGDQASMTLAVAGDDRLTIVDVIRWRDGAYRSGADGRASWALGADEFLVLGDHPSASTDSRRWGPVKATALRHRVVSR